MKDCAVEILDPGVGVSVQDSGRFGWKAFGVPASGAMDDHAADWANRLVDNPSDAALLEIVFQGAALRFRKELWVAVTGADLGVDLPMWEAVQVREGQEIHFPRNRSGLWAYVAIECGFMTPIHLGSASAFPHGGLGRHLRKGSVLRQAMGAPFDLPEGVHRRAATWSERRNYREPKRIRVWQGPQWGLFPVRERGRFFKQAWRVSSRSDRVGFRLTGANIKPSIANIISEPVRPGSIQVPEGGEPIVTMRDGPTVGGYPKIGLVDPEDLSWLAQCAPGQSVEFELVTDAK